MAKPTCPRNCGICPACAPAMKARIKAEAYPVVPPRNGYGPACRPEDLKRGDKK